VSCASLLALQAVEEGLFRFGGGRLLKARERLDGVDLVETEKASN